MKLKRSKERTYSANRLKELIQAATMLAYEGTQRMIEREKVYQAHDVATKKKRK